MNIEIELGHKLKNGIRYSEPMSQYTSWQVGGPAEYFVCPVDQEELVQIIRFSNQYALPLFVFGNGTNLLVLDSGIKGLTVRIGPDFSYINYLDEKITVVGAGTPMTVMAKKAVEKGFGGLEFAAGIPGSLGGAVIMNAGAFGSNIGSRVESVKIVSYNGDISSISEDKLVFGYRTSNLTDRGIIIEVNLKVVRGVPSELKKSMEYYLDQRRKRHPNLPSAGSVFRNMPDQPAGVIIEKAGCKGKKIGGAEVSRQHANFIVNTGTATASDILKLMTAVQMEVRKRYQIELTPEVKVVGEEQ